MGEPVAREIGRVEDADGEVLIVGIDRGTVTIGMEDRAPSWQFTPVDADELAALLITALWQAAAQGGAGHG